MLPTKTEYPDFVPDQLLTSDDLNALFGYLDEQGRLSRTNLIGIGILCGLEVRTRADGTAITVTKGTGVTSEGYLVTLDEAEYSDYVAFDPSPEIRYDKFTNADGTAKLELWELKRAAAVEGSTPLTFDFLDGSGDEDHRKVVVVFVELYLEHDKNCNPEDCDDKGHTIHVNLRVLLAREVDVKSLGLDAGLGASYFHDGFAALPEVPVPRFDVPAHELVTSAGIFTAYKKLLEPVRIASFGAALTELWNLAKDSFGADYGPTNPFAGMADAFALLDGSPISPTDLLSLQYVYDHFTDMVAAYEELREEGMQTAGVCCPDSDLFPRHLLLGRAIEDPHLVPVPLRHGFQASPIHGPRAGLEKLESLLRRLILMTQMFHVPPVREAEGEVDTFIRITPSRLGPDPLSVKAMPWHYPAHLPVPGPLYTWWDHAKTRAERADTNLGYHAPTYSSRSATLRPLAYDLEPYNFLRVEGHVGKPVAHVLQNLKMQVRRARLPIEVVALALGNDASGTHIADPTALIALHAQFEALKAEVLCCLRTQVRYWATLDTRGVFKETGKAPDHGFYQWLTGRSPVFVAGTRQAMKHAVVEASQEPLPPSQARLPGRPEVAEPTGAPLQRLASKKGQDLVNLLGHENVMGIGKTWLDHMVQGDVSLGFIPAPAGPKLGPPQLDHWALVIVDRIQELVVALEAEDLLSLDVDSVEAHGDGLIQALDNLTRLVDDHLAAQLPVAILKTYLGESREDQAELVGAIMHGMSEADAHTLVRLFLNLDESRINNLIHGLRNQGELGQQRALLRATFDALDVGTIAIPPPKRVIAENDPFFVEMRRRLRNFSCLCALKGLRHLRQRLMAWIELMRRLNLFAGFVRSHPGIQHKAGVPLGGTFILVYHRASRAGHSPIAVDFAERLGVELDALEQGPLDPAIQSAAADLAEGTVVADFYLPYLCCSDQPPIQFQVLENAPPPEDVTLALEPNEDTGTLNYSVGDAGFYAFAPFPPGGALDNAIPELGVVSPSAGSWQFRPAMTAARLDTDPTLEIEFTYSKDGVVSPALTVTVHNLPRVTIENKSPQDRYQVGDQLALESQVVLADTLLWVIRTPDGTTENVADKPELAPYDLQQTGVYVFQLHVTQSETGRVALSNTITIFVQGDATQPTLDLEPNPATGDHRYSVEDRNPYALTYSPDGGELEGASARVGVTRNPAGGHWFTPAGAAAALGDEAELSLTFVYSVRGVRSDPVKVKVFAEPVDSPDLGSRATVDPVCGDLQTLIDTYDGLEELDPDGFDLFNRRVLVDMGVEELFVQLRNMTNDTVEDRLQTFRVGSGARGSWVPRVTNIMDEIHGVLANRRSRVSKGLLTSAYRLLGRLLLYINCISPEDLVREQVVAMNRLARHVEGGEEVVSFESMQLDPGEMETVLAWKADVETALLNQIAAAEAGSPRKASYEAQLTKLRDAF